MINEQRPEDQTSKKDWALCHLNYERFSRSFDLYSNISLCQANFNSKMKKFQNDTREYLKQVVKSNDENKISELLRFYLAVLVSVTRSNVDTEYRIKNLSNEFNILNETLHNSFPDKLERLKQEMKTSRFNVINTINGLRNEVDRLNQLILDFQESLRFVINVNEIELKGSCPIERGYKRRFKWLPRRH